MQAREIPRLGGVSRTKPVSTAQAFGAIPIETAQNSIGFKSILEMAKTAMNEHYPYYAKSLKRKRNWGLEAMIDIYSNFSRKAEQNAKENYDAEEVARKNEFVRKQIDYNREKYRLDNILNSERAELLPIQVVNSLKAFDLLTVPISRDGRLLSPLENVDGFRLGAATYYSYNKKGEINPLKLPLLKAMIAYNTRVQPKFVTQFPEYRILRAWISRRGQFQSELQKILKYQNKMNNPKRMARLIGDKIGSVRPNNEVNDNVYEEARSFIHPSDMQNLRVLGDQILLPEQIQQFSTNKDRLKPFFNKMLNSGKLEGPIKRRFAAYMEKYPSDIRNMVI